MLLTTLGINVFLVITMLTPLIPVCIKETNRRMYRVLPFYIVNLLTIVPAAICVSIVYTSFVYWVAGIDPRFSLFLAFCGTIILVSVAGNSIGALISTILKNIHAGASIAGPVLFAISIPSGFYVSLKQIPALFRVIQYLSPLFYGYSILNQLQLGTGRATNCSSYLNNNTIANFESSRSLYLYCLRIGENRLYWTSGDAITFELCMLVLLIILVNMLAFAVLWYRTNRSQLWESWHSMRFRRQ